MMIIYLTSYPRSGNSWVAGIISHYFGIKTTSLYYRPGAENLSLNNGELKGNLFIDYVIPSTPPKIVHRLSHNCLVVLTPELRRKLALASNCYLIKTHETPYDEYFDGEYIIHIVRHPMAATWSYLKFREAELGKKISLEELIFSLGFENWNNHIMSWRKIWKSHPDKYLLIRYEDIAKDYSQFLANFKLVSGMEQITSDKYPDFSVWHSMDPSMYRAGNNQDWITSLTHEQIVKIWISYSEAMTELGYDLADLNIDLKSFFQFESKVPVSKETLDFVKSMIGVVPDLIRTANNIIQDQGTNIKSLGTNLGNKDKAIKYLNTQLQNKDKGIEYLSSQLQNKENELASLRANLEEYSMLKQSILFKVLAKLSVIRKPK